MTEILSPKQSTAEEDPVAEILKRANTVAVVGISEKPDRDSHKVAKYLKDHGYKIIPVNPKLKEVLGEPCYPDLKSIPEHVDLVDIFRSTDAIPGIVDEAIAVGAGSVWMQLGLIHQEAAEKARKAGLSVVMNRCTKIEHTRLSG
jgi:predicted CoA-binding protein